MNKRLPLAPEEMIARTTLEAQPLPVIPLIEVDRVVETIDSAGDRLASLMAKGNEVYGRTVLRIADRLTRHWLDRSESPYCGDILAISDRIRQPGAIMLNMSYEWACSTAVGRDPKAPGVRMLRTLDWPMPGIGRNVVVVRQSGPAGVFYNVSWPGYAGVLTAMAPGRFSAAINQPPPARYSPFAPLDWARRRLRVWRSREMPSAHLLRQVFENCRNYDEARTMLTESPLCSPAFYALAGVAGDEACVIERQERAGRVHETSTVITNHWLSFDNPSRMPDFDSYGRLKSMTESLACDDASSFAWLVPPILNGMTRLAVIANAAAGTLVVQGWEESRPATEVFSLVQRDYTNSCLVGAVGAA